MKTREPGWLDSLHVIGTQYGAQDAWLDRAPWPMDVAKAAKEDDGRTDLSFCPAVLTAATN